MEGVAGTTGVVAAIATKHTRSASLFGHLLRTGMRRLCSLSRRSHSIAHRANYCLAPYLSTFDPPSSATL
jgi:hypothetical protein